MRLTLKIADPSDLKGATPSRSIERGQLTIGRAESADWVLSDADRLLSKHHCRIEARHDRFILVDTSTNGVFLNDAPAPIGTGGEKTLEDGDRLQLGRYTLLASIEAPRDEEPISSLIESLPPLPSHDRPNAPSDEGWTEASFGAALPAHQEFFRPPPITAQGIPEDWLGDQPPSPPFPFENPAPSAAIEISARSTPVEISALPSPGAALGQVSAHLHALNDAIQAVIASLSPDQAAEAKALLTQVYHAKMAHYSGAS